MNKHFELIKRYCNVIEVVGDSAIYYKERGRGIAEINGASFSCSSLEEFHGMVELFGDDTFEE